MNVRVVSAMAAPGWASGVKFTHIPRTVHVPLAGLPFTATMSATPTNVAKVLAAAVEAVAFGSLASFEESLTSLTYAV